MSQPDFTVDIYQNEYLPEGARDVNAIVTVTTAGRLRYRPRKRTARRSSSSTAPGR